MSHGSLGFGNTGGDTWDDAVGALRRPKATAYEQSSTESLTLIDFTQCAVGFDLGDRQVFVSIVAGRDCRVVRVRDDARWRERRLRRQRVLAPRSGDADKKHKPGSSKDTRPWYTPPGASTRSATVRSGVGRNTRSKSSERTDPRSPPASGGGPTRRVRWRAARFSPLRARPLNCGGDGSRDPADSGQNATKTLPTLFSAGSALLHRNWFH